jgi:hypothetical protein
VRSDKHSLYFRWSQAWEWIGAGISGRGIGGSSTARPIARAGHLGNTFMLGQPGVQCSDRARNWTEQTIPNVKASPTAVGLPAAQVARFHVRDVMPSFGVANFRIGWGRRSAFHPERTETLTNSRTKEQAQHRSGTRGN